jgi:hypothetical protein
MSLTTTSPSRTLYCGNGSTAVQLRQFRDFARGEVLADGTVIGLLPDADVSRPLGVRTPHPWFGNAREYSWPPPCVHDTVDAALADRFHANGCRPVHEVDAKYGGGYVAVPFREHAARQIVVGTPLAWSHDDRFHWPECPDATNREDAGSGSDIETPLET